MRVRCLAQEHNTLTRPGLELGTFDPESSALTIRPPHLSRVAQSTYHNRRHYASSTLLVGKPRVSPSPMKELEDYHPA